jgi:hypothetical protein
VTLQIKGIVKSFATEGAKVSLCVTVTLHVTVEKPLKGEDLGTETTLKLGGIRVGASGRHLFNPSVIHRISGQRILDTIPSIYNLKRSVWWQAKLKKKQF